MKNEPTVKNELTAYERARKRVEEIKGLYIHAAVYAIVNLGLLAINLLTSTGYYWVVWPAIGWGIGLAIHAAIVLGAERFFGPEWEERKTRELLAREEDAHGDRKDLRQAPRP